jgi:hypothetical protein
MERMTLFLPSKRPTAAEVWAALPPAEQTQLWLALQHAHPLPRQQQSLDAPPRDWPGRWIGTQAFGELDQCLIPYLELASIIHVGRQTHLGCGAFRLS